MAVRGRKPTPTAIKRVTGNPGKRPLSADEPVVPSGVPDRPPELLPDAVAEWERVVPVLCAAGIAKPVDRAALVAYCNAWGRWVQAQRVLATMAAQDEASEGLLVRTSKGGVVQNPLVGVRNKAEADLLRAAAELGITPSARSRVKAELEDDEDPTARYIQ